MALSKDLRGRIVELVTTGVPRRDVARRFQVSASSAIRSVRQAAEFGHVEAKAPKKHKNILDPDRADIIDWIGEQPDLTLIGILAM